MNKKKKNKRVAWTEPHKCIHCGHTIEMLLCPHCNKISMKGMEK